MAIAGRSKVQRMASNGRHGQAGELVGLGGTGHELAGGLGRSDPQMAKSTLAR